MSLRLKSFCSVPACCMGYCSRGFCSRGYCSRGISTRFRNCFVSARQMRCKSSLTAAAAATHDEGPRAAPHDGACQYGVHFEYGACVYAAAAISMERYQVCTFS
mmetsp:Transcript_5514/g.14884  ORF Transcript_5514/g.14884 Transcript_5514/m.14884 type:complete len:104 (+) Transcript_5514:2088-2399(+)